MLGSLVIAAGMTLMEYFFWRGEVQEFLCTIYIVPVMVMNLWEFPKREMGERAIING